MSAQPQPALEPLLTEDQYLARERGAEGKSEFYDGRMVAMAGAKAAHNAIIWNTVLAIGNRLTGFCQGYASDMRVRVPSGPNFYPDVVVCCGKPQLRDAHKDVLLNPILIVEVLSPSTEAFDRGHKFELYRTIPSLQVYLMLTQDRVHVDLYTRQADDRWLLTGHRQPWTYRPSTATYPSPNSTGTSSTRPSSPAWLPPPLPES